MQLHRANYLYVFHNSAWLNFNSAAGNKFLKMMLQIHLEYSKEKQISVQMQIDIAQ